MHCCRSTRSIAKVATRCAKKMANAPATPPDDIACLIAVYNRLKTFRLVPPSSILDSLACLFFFADEGCKANLVIGVKENPYMTHAWLEINGAVANEIDAIVLNYTPILQTNNEGHLREASDRPCADRCLA
ncbi:lasso peptide biosynthesis B2 protein [Pararhizobium sp. BT-229]|uniref:lasso peptide biosynthesis B2 protein n=1 Tax=Pararhizobium sp. BT-229 TaxID=2986923 RepID=UPI003556539A